MKTMNVYLYWYGDQNIKNQIKQKITKISKQIKNVNIILGPSNDEHNFLLQKYSFYKKAIESNRYSFAADLYRVWKLSSEKCMYWDATIKVNPDKFIVLLNKLHNYETILIKENGHLIWNGILYSRNQFLFKRILNFYQYHPKIANTLTGPLIYSMFAYQEYGCKLNNNKVLYLDSRDIDPYSSESTFNYNGLGSWGGNKVIDYDNPEKTGAHNYFHNNAIKFETGFCKSWIIVRWFIKNYLIYLLPIIMFNMNRKEIKI